MNKKLPSIYANKIDKTLNNNNKIYYSSKDERNIIDKSDLKKDSYQEIDGKNILQKINSIFNSSNYIYKADVKIILKDKTIEKRIIGKNKTHLITNENELIPISEIIDIKKSL